MNQRAHSLTTVSVALNPRVPIREIVRLCDEAIAQGRAQAARLRGQGQVLLSVGTTMVHAEEGQCVPLFIATCDEYPT